ncbi:MULTISPECIES: DUF1641 domain-containing protein [Cytobacillus]|uniref:DUF1641 domain-containing protein n=1 Tax=Cytobacillus TaxID=2675230 RepID=UPI001CD550E5|nr:DUF1641 domain-containing protein [Cytobacillus kochii]MCA1027991.1 DUF1641 domain-containing protein [Cytobacillus kochii]MCM3323901.1 DUF1641 domain-containing protein [Cytobacillus kochii]MCM3346298.1 DUF1641 domain-containing protein [Cytobacillus kochii]
MAKATTVIRKIEVSPEEQRKRELKELEDSIVNNRRAIIDSIHLIQRIHEKGILHIVESMLGQSDKILDRVLLSMEHPEVTGSIKNSFLLLEVLGKMDLKEWEPMIDKINTALTRMVEVQQSDKEKKEVTMLSMLRDSEVREGMSILLAFVKGLGSSEGKEKEEIVKQNPDTRKFNKNWLFFIGGAAVMSIPLFLKRK